MLPRLLRLPCVHKSITFCFTTIQIKFKFLKPYLFRKPLSSTVTTIPFEPYFVLKQDMLIRFMFWSCMFCTEGPQ